MHHQQQQQQRQEEQPTKATTANFYLFFFLLFFLLLFLLYSEPGHTMTKAIKKTTKGDFRLRKHQMISAYGNTR